MSARLELRALRHRRLTPGACRGAGLVETSRALGALVGAEAVTARGDAAVDDHVLSSTILASQLMDGGPCSQALRDAVADHTARPIDWLTHAYECAGWGYVMRQVLDKATVSGQRTLLLQIVDVDIHDFTYWYANPQWGDSGFGITSILVDVEPGPGPRDTWPLALGAATPASAMVQMGRALQAFSAARPGVPVAVPFFREASRKLLLRRVAGAPVHADGYPQFGHAFGSDPWISLLLDATADRKPARSIVNSLALYGYFAIAELAIAADTRLGLQVAS
jgi:hypothetical protein